MAEDATKVRGLAMDHQPEERGYVPAKVQGGYKPATSQHGPPPTGGSAVKPKK